MDGQNYPVQNVLTSTSLFKVIHSLTLLRARPFSGKGYLCVKPWQESSPVVNSPLRLITDRAEPGFTSVRGCPLSPSKVDVSASGAAGSLTLSALHMCVFLCSARGVGSAVRKSIALICTIVWSGCSAVFHFEYSPWLNQKLDSWKFYFLFCFLKDHDSNSTVLSGSWSSF